MEKIRYVDYQREVAVERIEVSYNNLTPKLDAGPDGNIPKYEPEKVKLRPMDAARLVQSYAHGRFMEQVQAVINAHREDRRAAEALRCGRRVLAEELEAEEGVAFAAAQGRRAAQEVRACNI